MDDTCGDSSGGQQAGVRKDAKYWFRRWATHGSGLQPEESRIDLTVQTRIELEEGGSLLGLDDTAKTELERQYRKSVIACEKADELERKRLVRLGAAQYFGGWILVFLPFFVVGNHQFLWATLLFAWLLSCVVSLLLSVPKVGGVLSLLFFLGLPSLSIALLIQRDLLHSPLAASFLWRNLAVDWPEPTIYAFGLLLLLYLALTVDSPLRRSLRFGVWRRCGEREATVILLLLSANILSRPSVFTESEHADRLDYYLEFATELASLIPDTKLSRDADAYAVTYQLYSKVAAGLRFRRRMLLVPDGQTARDVRPELCRCAAALLLRRSDAMVLETPKRMVGTDNKQGRVGQTLRLIAAGAVPAAVLYFAVRFGVPLGETALAGLTAFAVVWLILHLILAIDPKIRQRITLLQELVNLTRSAREAVAPPPDAKGEGPPRDPSAQ